MPEPANIEYSILLILSNYQFKKKSFIMFILISCATGSSTCSLDYSCTAVGAGHSLCCPTTPQQSSAAVAVVSNGIN